MWERHWMQIMYLVASHAGKDGCAQSHWSARQSYCLTHLFFPAIIFTFFPLNISGCSLWNWETEVSWRVPWSDDPPPFHHRYGEQVQDWASPRRTRERGQDWRHHRGTGPFQDCPQSSLNNHPLAKLWKCWPTYPCYAISAFRTMITLLCCMNQYLHMTDGIYWENVRKCDCMHPNVFY